MIRTDEATFRASVPSQVGHLRICKVGTFFPGDGSSYANAYAVTQGRGEQWSTHLLICLDDEQWIAEHGHYGFATEAKAWEDVSERVEWKRKLRGA